MFNNVWIWQWESPIVTSPHKTRAEPMYLPLIWRACHKPPGEWPVSLQPSAEWWTPIWCQNSAGSYASQDISQDKLKENGKCSYSTISCQYCNHTDSLVSTFQSFNMKTAIGINCHHLCPTQCINGSKVTCLWLQANRWVECSYSINLWLYNLSTQQPLKTYLLGNISPLIRKVEPKRRSCYSACSCVTGEVVQQWPSTLE